MNAVPLGDLCDVLDSRRKPITKRDRTLGEFPYYGATGILDYVSGYIFDEKLVLIGEDGAKWGAGEKTAFAAAGKYWVNNHAHVIRPHRDKVTDEWIIYYLNFSDLSAFITGLTVPKLNQGKLREIPIPLPPLQEQQRIVAILDEGFAGLATTTANAEKNLSNARELFDSYLSSVFAQKGAGRIEKRLSEVCREMTVGHVGPMAKRYKQSGIPFLRSQNVRPFEVDLNDVVFIDDAFHRELGKSQLRPGDVAIVRTGYPGTASVIPKTLEIANCADLVIVRPGEQIDSRFIAAFFNSSFGKRLVGGNLNGAAQKHFNVTSAKAVKIALPVLAEQQRLAEKIDEVRAECRALELAYQKKIANITEMKQSILQKAFSGEMALPRSQAIKVAAE